MNSNVILGFIGTLGSLITIIIWAKDNFKAKPRRLVYPIILVLLTAFSTYQFHVNSKIMSARYEAAQLVSTWPKVENLPFISKGERIGIILGGLGFLEKHKEEFPETHNTALGLIDNRLNNFRAPKGDSEDYKEFDLLEDVSGAMIQIISSIAR